VPKPTKSPTIQGLLEQYREKRDFEKTPEPPPGKAPAEGALIFVIQKHAATRLHYDFRLEFDGVLKSWPVPKGPSLNPTDKRLAMMVEDHPVDYASFEGAIPKGEYGGGQVIVWDAGTYSPDEDGLVFDDREEADRRMQEGLAKGKLSFFLRGHKLKGSFTLVRIGQRRKEAQGKEWLLIKHKDRFVDTEREVTEEGASVISGLTIADIKAGRLPDRALGRLVARPGDLRGAARAQLPKMMESMQATLTERPFSSPDWYFEPKLDGVRAISLIHEGEARLFSRRGIEATKTYPGIAAELGEQPSPAMVLDGEIVALGENGVPSFQRLQQRFGLQRETDIKRAESEIPVLYYVFDILYAEGYDLRGAPLSERKSLLEQIVAPGPCVQLVHHFEEEGEAAYEAAVRLGLEGLIAKRRDSVYESGRRSRYWLKIKAVQEQEFVVGGYSGGEGGRVGTFGSLLLGYYDDGKLTYVGNVGSGFDDRMLETLKRRLEKLRTKTNPFAGDPKRSAVAFRRPKNVPVYFVRPELVAQVRFAQWTDEGILRAPSFLGLREDKAPRDVRREEATPPPEGDAIQGGRSHVAADEVQGVLEQLESKSEKFLLRVGGHKIPLNNLDKEFWPPYDGRRALTKRDLLRYLARVSPHLLPHMRDRPITLTRYPNGILAKHFYQKHWEAKLPEFVERVRLWSDQNEGDGDYLVCNNLPTLLWLGQLADIELHTWYSRVDPAPDGEHLTTTFAGSRRNIERSLLNYPEFIVFDLDPYIYSGQEKKGDEPELNRKAFQKTCEVALWLKDLLDSMSLSSFVKTTGKTGLHIYVPILRRLDYGAVRASAETIGKFLAGAHPRDITMKWAVDKRKGKIFFDHNQNVRGKTLASVYSPRPSPQAAVSMPVRWEELGDVYPPDFTILTAPDRLEQTGDLWATILNEKHDLVALLGIAEE
jgi:bifunctional non-homologous end joining protein LigD